MEIEIKYSPVTKEEFDKIKKELEGKDSHIINMKAYYFDNEDKTLSRAKLSFRMRMENEERIFTIKRHKGFLGEIAIREEYEARAEDINGAIEEFKKNPLVSSDIIALLKKLPLTADIAMSFVRESVMVQEEKGIFELSYDSGVMKKGQLEGKIEEMEAELKSGTKENMEAFAEKLKKYGLRTEKDSKLKRAKELK